MVTKYPYRSAIAFIVIGLALYAAVAYGAERLMYRHGHANPFFKTETSRERNFDWVILGASHAMVFDFSDLNARLEQQTGLRIINLAAIGTGPLYNRFVLEHFLQRAKARKLLYVLDSFAFYSRIWNEDRFMDAKLQRGTPFDPNIMRLLWGYTRDAGVDTRAVLDYATLFSKINNRERFQQDVWEGELQFERVFRPSVSAVQKRIDYLYPDGASATGLARYLAAFDALLGIAQQSGLEVLVIKLPLPAPFHAQLLGEPAFDHAVSGLLARRGIEFHDFSAAMPEPRFYSDTDHLNRVGAEEFLTRYLKDDLRGAVAE